jgi:hypothetical protein
VVTQPGQDIGIPPVDGVRTVTVLLARHGLPAAPHGGCVAADQAAWDAYADLAGVSADNLAGTQFLIDPDGWLRALRRPGEAGGWSSPNELVAAVRAICTSPVAHADGGIHGHHT